MAPPVLVLGATGTLGEALAEALLQTGRNVIAVADDPDGLALVAARLRAHGRVVTVPGSVRDAASAAALAQRIGRLAVVPSAVVLNLAGPCERGLLLDGPEGLLERRLHADVLPYVHAARHLIPLLADTGLCARFVVVGAPYAGTPWLGFGHQSITAAAVRMLVQVLRQETKETTVRVQQLVLDAPVRTADNVACAAPGWLDPIDVGRRAAEVLVDPDDSATFIHVGN